MTITTTFDNAMIIIRKEAQCASFNKESVTSATNVIISEAQKIFHLSDEKRTKLNLDLIACIKRAEDIKIKNCIEKCLNFVSRVPSEVAQLSCYFSGPINKFRSLIQKGINLKGINANSVQQVIRLYTLTVIRLAFDMYKKHLQPVVLFRESSTINNYSNIKFFVITSCDKSTKPESDKDLTHRLCGYDAGEQKWGFYFSQKDGKAKLDGKLPTFDTLEGLINHQYEEAIRLIPEDYPIEKFIEKNYQYVLK